MNNRRRLISRTYRKQINYLWILRPKHNLIITKDIYKWFEAYNQKLLKESTRIYRKLALYGSTTFEI